MLSSAAALRGLRASSSRLPCRRYASHGAPQYNEPSGWLFGEKPPLPGQKRVKETWENAWYIGMFGTMAFATVMLYYKPDTSIQTWALKEAKERMDARGEKYQYEPQTSSSSRPS
ncbi:ESSS subunit of NADH:ubiquinone oxidoreductase [Panaeolus papilionaceus]|nr:ESSS subunit of NADH:ubiquinone oxidoreductase [Panaeolus papilionaceus]